MSFTLPVVTQGRKAEITPGNVTARNVCRMAKYVDSHEVREGWRGLMHSWERLKWARLHWQHQNELPATAKHAAEALHMNEHTYRAYERPEGSSKHIPLKHQDAIRFARKFKISWQWLLENHGTPFDTQLPEAQLRVIQAMSNADEDQQNRLADMVEAFLRPQKQAQ